MDEPIVSADALKQQANHAFNSDQIKNAVSLYTQALNAPDCTPELKALLYCNRAAAYLRLKDHQKALEDANGAILINSKLIKAIYRKALALEALDEPFSALAAARTALALDAKDTAIRELASRLAPYSGPHKPPITRNSLPRLLQSAPFEYIPSSDGINENLLILFHGLGDTPSAFAKLAKTMNLPQTAALALSGPQEVPFSDGGRSWFDGDFGLIDGSRPGEERRIKSLDTTVDAIIQLLDNLQVHCGWEKRKIHLLGFSQGGTVALQLARKVVLHSNFGSVIGICCSLLKEDKEEEEPLNVQQKQQDILLLYGDRDATVNVNQVETTISRLSIEGMNVEEAMIKGKGHGMIQSPEEARIVMKFLSSKLSYRPVGHQNEEDETLVELSL